MRHRKCDTAKYRRRIAKQSENKLREKRQRERQRREEALLYPQKLQSSYNPYWQMEKDRLLHRLHEILVLRVNALSEPEGEAAPEEVGQMVAEAEKPAVVVCPLCNLPLTVADAVDKNMKTMQVNYQPVQVHVTCPTEVK